ncbi:MAG: alkaline phosphatase [Bacteroidota bacterium]
MNLFKIQLFIAALLISVSGIEAQDFKDGKYAKEIPAGTYSLDKKYEVEEITDYKGDKTTAKNIILLIGDGMGISHVFAAITANNGNAYFEKFYNIGFSKTQSADKFNTDSAAGGTAIATGEKTNKGAIGVDTEGKTAETILEIADKNGKYTGMVAASSITHATPASFIAHQPSRRMYEEIAKDFLNTDIEIFIGGGMDNFKSREDGVDLIKKLEEKGYTVLESLENIEKYNGNKLAGLIYPKHPGKYSDRGEMLVPATKKSIDLLNKSENGFFLMVEGSQIDWAAHDNNTKDLLDEMAEFDRAVGEALKFAEKDGNTLVIVTADHETGGLSVNGGNSEEGYVEGKYTSKSHTGMMVPVFAYGPGAEQFKGIYDNTELFYKMMKAFGFSPVELVNK